MIYPAEYEVEIYNEFKGEMEICHGITIAESYADAMDKIENYYGEELNKVTILLLEEATVYEFENTNSNFSHGMFKIENVSKW